MITEMPKKLNLAPLQEIIFEMQFEPVMPTAGDILPGLLYRAVSADYPEVTPLPMANVPRNVRQQHPELNYQASHSLYGTSGSIRVGDRSISLVPVEYPGWVLFKAKLLSLIQAFRATEQAKLITRFSFKYTNVIEASSEEAHLSFLNVKIESVGGSPRERGFLLRTEFVQGKHTTIVQISPQSEVKVPSRNKIVLGLLVDVDTIRFEPGPEFLANPDPLLEEAHLVAKQMFFSLLTRSTVERLQPVW